MCFTTSKVQKIIMQQLFLKSSSFCMIVN